MGSGPASGQGYVTDDIDYFSFTGGVRFHYEKDQSHYLGWDKKRFF